MNTLPPMWRSTTDTLWPDVEPVLRGIRSVVHDIPWVEVNTRWLTDRAEVRVDVHDGGEPGVQVFARLMGGPLRVVGMRQHPDRWLECGSNRHRHCAEHRWIFHRLEVTVRRLGPVQLIEEPRAPEPRLPPVITGTEAQRMGELGQPLVAANAEDPRIAEMYAHGRFQRDAYGGDPCDPDRSRRGLGS